MKETDLHEPIARFFQARGYTVQGEVKGCDLVAIAADEVIAVEFKRHFSVDLLVQAIDRQQFADAVYIAIPRPVTKTRSRQWRGQLNLLRRLELGLLLVSFNSARPPLVEVALDISPYQPRKSKRMRATVIKEALGRSSNTNQGGSVRRKLVTAYRERAIHLACILQERGPLSTRELGEMTNYPKVATMLSQNHYGWFERVSHGVYRITTTGEADLTNYSDLTKHYMV